MKITKSQLKQIIKEELNKTLKEADFIGPFAPPRVGLDTTGKLKPGTVIPRGMEQTRPALDEVQVMEAVKEVLDLAYGPDGYDLGAKLMELSKSASGKPAIDPENRNAAAWDFFKRADERSGKVSPEVESRMKNPFSK